MPTVHHFPLTFRQVRADSYVIQRDGQHLGALYQMPNNAERHANCWRYWPHRQAPTPHFRTLEEAQAAIREMH